MTTKELSSGLVMIAASEGCVLRKKGSDPHSSIRQTTVKAADLADWEEVEASEVPPYTKEEYDAKVSEIVRERYSADEEFAIQRKMLKLMLSPDPVPMSEAGPDPALGPQKEFEAYNEYVELCKLQAPTAIAAEKARAEEAATYIPRTM